MVRAANLLDVKDLSNFYLDLPLSTRPFFHPFEFGKIKVTMIFLAMILSSRLPINIRRIIPKLSCGVVIAKDMRHSKLMGFVFYNVTSKKNNITVANAGPVISGEIRGRGIATEMYNLVLSQAKAAGITKILVTIMEENINSIEFHRKLGFVKRGSAVDEIWDGRRYLNAKWELALDK
jgi:GNAT superfamily N-acetyltransferase